MAIAVRPTSGHGITQPYRPAAEGQRAMTLPTISDGTERPAMQASRSRDQATVFAEASDRNAAPRVPTRHAEPAAHRDAPAEQPDAPAADARPPVRGDVMPRQPTRSYD